MKWPWSKYTVLDKKHSMTDTDKMGKILERLKDAAVRIEDNTAQLSLIIEQLYKQNYSLVIKLREKEDGKK